MQSAAQKLVTSKLKTLQNDQNHHSSASFSSGIACALRLIVSVSGLVQGWKYADRLHKSYAIDTTSHPSHEL